MRIGKKTIAVSFLAVAISGNFAPSRGQEKKEATQPAPAAAAKTAAETPAAKPEDVKSLDAIVAAIYDVISGPAGQRDWNRFNSLFAKEARLIAVRTPKDGGR